MQTHELNKHSNIISDTRESKTFGHYPPITSSKIIIYGFHNEQGRACIAFLYVLFAFYMFMF